MANIIVAFSRPEDGKSIKGILVRSGYDVAAVCMSGSQALSAAEDLSGGILVCGYRFEDMMYDELRQCLSASFEMLVLASPSRWNGVQTQGVVCLPMPLKVHNLLSTLDMMVQAQQRIRRKLRSRPKERSKEEQDLINEAKALLMERNNMTEEEAHRYLQKNSMDTGTSMIETAQMILTIMSE